MKRKGWINIYKPTTRGSRCGSEIFSTKEQALKSRLPGFTVLDTIKIEWEETNESEN